jgi:hypothetical protein
VFVYHKALALGQSQTARPQRQFEVGKHNQRMMTMAARKQLADQ